MTTDNPKISLYVPREIYEVFNKFKKERRLSMSQAGIAILSEYFGIKETIKETTKGTTVGGVSLARFEELENNYKKIVARIEALESVSSSRSIPKSSLIRKEEESNQLVLTQLMEDDW
jgi:hypothetical protein